VPRCAEDRIWGGLGEGGVDGADQNERGDEAGERPQEWVAAQFDRNDPHGHRDDDCADDDRRRPTSVWDGRPGLEAG